MLPEKLFAYPNFSMLCGILAKACILGKFHPQPSSLHSGQDDLILSAIQAK
jgi:hypothetical protein